MAMASPFFWAGELTFEFSSRQVSPSLDLPVLWMGMAFVWAVLLLDLAYCEFDRRLGRIEDPSASLGWPSARARLAALGYVLASTLLLVLLLRRDWVFAAAVHFALGSTVIAGMAASTSSVDLIRSREGQLSTSGLMPARVIIVKWLGTFRYALVFAVLPILIMVVQTGPDFGLWSRFADGDLLHLRSVCGGHQPWCGDVCEVPGTLAGGSLRGAHFRPGDASVVRAGRTAWTNGAGKCRLRERPDSGNRGLDLFTRECTRPGEPGDRDVRLMCRPPPVSRAGDAQAK